jgi:hypothetical protein
LGYQSTNGERHGNPVIAIAVNFRAAQGLSPGYAQSIRQFFHLGTHSLQVLSDRGQPVTLFHSQLARTPKRKAFLCLRSDHR